MSDGVQVPNETTQLIGGTGAPRQLAYRGKEGCESVICTQAPFAREQGKCYGWHCAVCHEPSSYQGHPDCVQVPS